MHTCHMICEFSYSFKFDVPEYHYALSQFLCLQVSVIFEDNSAAVGPLVYASNLDGCLWYDLNNGTAYFSNDYTQFWSFMDVR